MKLKTAFIPYILMTYFEEKIRKQFGLCDFV